jgi:fatty acid desaturase
VAEFQDGFAYSRDDQNLRQQITSLIGRDRIEEFRKVDFSRTIFDLTIVFSIFTFSFMTAALAISVGKYTIGIIGGALLAGVGFNWLNVQIHEGSHYLLAMSKALNDFIANIILGSFGFQSVLEYRESHYLHHGHLNQDQDPDKYFYQSMIATKKDFIFFLIKIAMGAAVFQKIKKGSWVPGSEDNSKTTSDPRPYIGGLLFHLTIVFVLLTKVNVSSALTYVAIIFFGLASVFPVLLGIRTWIQHKDQRSPLEISIERSRLQTGFMSRTTVTSIAERLFIGARMEYHFEHHLFSRIPHYNLKCLHEELVILGFFESDVTKKYITENYVKSSLLLAS